MDFEDALRRMAPLDRVGPLRLRYEPSLLIGEPIGKDSREPIALAFRVIALLFGVSAMAALLTARGSGFPLLAGVFALLAIFSYGASAWFERRERPRRFVLNFGTESLRIDDLPSPLRRPRTRTVHFDQVASVDVIPARRGFALAVTFRPDVAGPQVELLTAAIPAEHIEELRRLWRVLRDGFGLSGREERLA